MPDTISTHGFIHRIGVEERPQYVFPTNNFFKGGNEVSSWDPIRHAQAIHLRYSFQFRPGSCASRIYGAAYQGAGVALSSFGNAKEIGTPILFYLFQGARIARFTSRLSLNYEWNFGLSTGWHPYDALENAANTAVGSRINAYLNAAVYFNWSFATHFDLVLGADLTHFSNGNTKFPNAGVNTTGAKIGLVYNFNRNADELLSSASHAFSHHFPKHISYDLLLFGSWRRKGVYVDDNKQVASPSAYPVAGFNFAPMYNLTYKFRFGLSFDGVYDGSANVYAKDPGSEKIPSAHHEHSEPPRQDNEYQFLRPAFGKQVALGISGRFEYVMPYFTINAGMGLNVLGRGDLKGWYQVLALKIRLTRSSFLHVGYNLQNFKTPNYLMLGIGYRFHNKYPKVRY
jgi:hypothetical protein